MTKKGKTMSKTLTPNQIIKLLSDESMIEQEILIHDSNIMTLIDKKAPIAIMLEYLNENY